MKKSKINIKLLCLYGLFAAAVIACGVIGGDRWYNIVCSVAAIVYLLLLTDGVKYGYLLCAAYAAGYTAIAFGSGFYATAAFHALVLLPTAIYRFIASFGKNAGEEKIGALSVKGWAAATMACCALSAGLYFLLRAVGDSQPLLDGAILSLSLLTSLFMLRNYSEMWLFNLGGSVLYVVMWTVQYVTSGAGLAFAVVQAIVSVINVKGVIDWKRRAGRNKENKE